ncbi:MAG: lysophospholipid acyltransferase family protein [Nannocystaceae bacterium]
MDRRKSLISQLTARLRSPEVAELVRRIPKPVGSFGYDPWGYHAENLELAISVFKWLYDHYFRVRAVGLEHVPDHGRVLLVANHSGQLPLDGVLIGIALATNPSGPRAPRAMVERFLPTMPWVGNLLNSWGAVLGDPQNCIKMLEREEPVIVFPEGVRGSGKPFSERYRLKRFGNGFVHMAMKTGAPIVPVGVVGCEETLPSLGNLKPIARLFGLPYLPMMVPVPLPARVSLHFGEPLVFADDARSEADIEGRVDQVKTAIRDLVDQGLSERTSVF